MKKGKLYLLVTLALTLIISVVCASVSAFAAESSVNNGWGTAPEGKNIEAINDLKEVEGYGEGYTSISGLHANSAANATPLDLTKPISLNFSVKNRSENNWTFFGVAPTLEKAKAVDNEIYTASLADYPFVHMFDTSAGIGIWHQTEGAMASAPIIDRQGPGVYDFRAQPVVNGEAHEYKIEIYFGETQEKGYMLIDGIYVGRPAAVQADFPQKTGYFFVNGWSPMEWIIKITQPETAKNIVGSYNVYRYQYLGGARQPLEAGAVNVNYVDATHEFGRAVPGDEIRFTVTAGKYAISKVYVSGYTGAELSFDPSNPGTYAEVPCEGGVYSWTMPDATIGFIFEMDTDLFVVERAVKEVYLKVEGDVVTLKNGESMTFSVTPFSFTHEVAKVAYQFGDAPEVLYEIAEDNTYVLTIPKDLPKGTPVRIVAEGRLKPVTAPTDAMTENSVNGWDTNNDGKYGAMWSEGVQQIFDVGDGSTFVVLDNASSISSTSALDVTKPIYFDIVGKYNGVTDQTWWIMCSLWDDFEVGVKLNAEVYGTSPYEEYNNASNARKKFSLTWYDLNNINVGLSSFSDDVYDNETVAQMPNYFGENYDFDSEKKNYGAGTLTQFEIYFGETQEEGYVKMNGTRVGTPNAVQSDFANGVAYMHVSSFMSANLRMKLYQSAELDIQSGVDEHAAVTVVGDTDLSRLLAYDEVKLQIEFDEGYTAKKITVGGKPVEKGEDGYYTFRVPFGSNVLNVESGEVIRVSFETNGGSAVEEIAMAAGGILSEPVSTKAGYTVSWFRDAALTQPMDFSAGVETSCTLYAKWTPITYYITYYDDVNKIRDLEHNTYTVEDAFELERFEKEGYVFEGWYDNPQCEGEAIGEITAGSTGDLILYAKLTEQKGCGSMNAASVGILGLGALLAAGWIFRKKRG